MPVSFLLERLEDDGYCASCDIERNYILSETVKDDRLEKLDKAMLDQKIQEIATKIAVSIETIYSIYYGLLMGNVILEGPPGTGKTTLVKLICKELFNVKLEEATANIEWTVYDLVGRKTLDIKDGKEAAVPEDGHITRSIVDCCKQIALHEEGGNSVQATWLLIDEINRCKIDRAFGEFFTVLAGSEEQKLKLSYQDKDNQTLYVPKCFRIIGTMNSVDKSFVNSFSQAFARRFHFVMVDIPRNDQLIDKEKEVSLRVATKEVSELLDLAHDHVQEVANEEEVKLAIREIDDFFRLIRFGDENFGEVIPLGTAQLIDVKKAFLLKYIADEGVSDVVVCMNWALGAKLLNQFDSSNVTEETQRAFANAIPRNLKGIKENVQTIWGLLEGTEA